MVKSTLVEQWCDWKSLSDTLEEKLERIQTQQGGRILNIFETKVPKRYSTDQAFIIIYETNDSNK